MRRTTMKTMLATLAVLGVVASAGCTPTAGSGTAVPGAAGGGNKDGAAPAGTQEGDLPSELQKRLERLTGEQEARMADAMVDTKACHDLCSLSASICEVQVKLCDIADRRPQEGAYQDLCREAQQECREATQACEDCVSGHQDEAVTMPPSE